MTNPLVLAQQYRFDCMPTNLALTGPRSHREAARLLDAIHAEALAKADHWVTEMEAGRGYGEITLDYVRDLLEIVHAVAAMRIPKVAAA